MAKIKEYRAARRTLEESVAALIDHARCFNDSTSQHRVRDLLYAGREYGRALNRVERMRAR